MLEKLEEEINQTFIPFLLFVVLNISKRFCRCS